MHSGYRTERRRYQRLRVTLAVQFLIDGPEYLRRFLGRREYEGETFDLSEGGVSLLAPSYLPEGTRLFLKFIVIESSQKSSPQFREIVTLRGEILSVIPHPDGRYRLCISFGKVTEDIEEKFCDLICSPLKSMSSEPVRK